jgi:hypothetical protein
MAGEVTLSFSSAKISTKYIKRNISPRASAVTTSTAIENHEISFDMSSNVLCGLSFPPPNETCFFPQIATSISVYYYREVKEIVTNFNTAYKQNVSPNTSLTTRLYNKPKLHYISATANDATTTTASATTFSAATTTTTSTQHRKEATGRNL